MTGVSFPVKRRYAGSRREKFYTQSLTFRICSINYEFFQIFFLIFEIFFGSFEKTIKSHDIGGGIGVQNVEDYESSKLWK